MAIIGIDLGTSNSLVSLWREHGVELIPNGLGETLTPSVVSIDEDGALLVGQTAKERLISAPEKTAAEFKRFMGTDKKYFLGGNTYTPEDLSSFVLRKLKDDAERYLAENYPGETITEAVVSVPAYFNDNQRAATKRAGFLADLTVERILNEPSAAALTCRLYDREVDFTALVFDFGGGTLDVSVVDCFDNMVSVLAVSGDNRLGGADFDHQIALEFCTVNNLRFDRLSPLTQASLRYQAEIAKLRLSEGDTSTIIIPDGEAAGTLELTNQKLVDICASLFQRMGVPLRRALVDSQKTLEDLTRVILVGGSCKMPVVQDYLRQLLRRELESPFSPDTVVGLGVGVYAGIRERRESIRDIVMTDLCPFTLGTSVRNKMNGSLPLYAPIIERNSILPCSRVARHYTVGNFQTQVRVDVFQGEERYCKDNLKLGEFSVQVPSAPAGKEAVDIRFTYDINGILEVEVTIDSTGQVYRELFLGKSNTLTDEQVKQRLKELSGLKLPPHGREEIRALIAHGERLYAQSTGRTREAVAEALDYFIGVADKGAPTTLAREINTFREFLQSAEKRILGEGLFPSDFSDDEDDADDFWEEYPRNPSSPQGNSSGGDSSPPVQ
jgi:molecular chaperone HscC